MLVSSIARFDALSSMNNAAFAASQTANAISGVVHTFHGDQDLSRLNQIENKLSLDLIISCLRYKLANIQEQMFSKQQNADVKSLNFIA